MKKRILIIDDDKDYASLLKIRLESLSGYEVAAFTEAKDIISRIHVFKPDVILLDLLMPGIGGLDVCDMLDNDPIGLITPIIVVSGLDKDADKLSAYKFGITDYLVKPVDNAKLVGAIEKAIKSKSGNLD